MIKYDILKISNKHLSEIADKVARDFQITIGTNTIPMLMYDIEKNETVSEERMNTNEEGLFIYKKRDYTGRILIDLSDEKCASMQLEYLDEDGEKKIQTVRLPRVNLTHDVIPTLLQLSISENVDFIQMFDTSMLLNNASYDDSTVMECIMEKIGEWQQYSRSMAIFDVDSLIGVNENISDSSLGQTSSYSIQNNRLWQQVVIQTANSKLSADSKNNHKWVVVISKIEFICRQFKSLTRFPPTEDELFEEEENAKIRECKNCRMPYSNTKNNIDSCSFHDAPLIDIRASHMELIHLNINSLYENFVNYDTQNRQDMLKNFVYLCCFQSFNSTGCKKSFHSDEKDNRNLEKYKKYF